MTRAFDSIARGEDAVGVASQPVPASPITGGPGVSLFDEIRVSDIIGAYRAIGIEVAHLFAQLRSVPVYRCDQTGYRFYYLHSLAADGNFYAHLHKVIPYYAEWRWEHQQTLQYLANARRLLEIGAGSGNFLARVTRELGLAAEGLELNPSALAEAPQRGLSVNDRSLEDVAKGQSGTFDIVCAFQVLEHVPNVASFLGAAIDALKVGCRLIVGVPNSNPYVFKYDRLHALNLPPHHMGLWNRESLAALASVFPLRHLRTHVEPLDDVDYFYEVYLQHVERARPLLYRVLRRLPWRARKYLYDYFRRSVEGRNLLAVFEKRA